ncbi:hypothetical protein AJ79_05591 [Helicocarpus griseus UAMH5409]|uniref:Cell surface protein n=1 Tax=Helicocarpus griseus UAMH5409 TaxID=1447875 RepID=A0A2B7XLP0_9EURO|nr:hypothetical protein AJ79_05591 [Helicocarpus griseus UAMH5409]
MSGIAHKVKDTLTGHTHHKAAPTQTSGGEQNPAFHGGASASTPAHDPTYGSSSGPTHSSSTANKLDPRVNQGNQTGAGSSYGANTQTGPEHSSSTANAFDPRVKEQGIHTGTGIGTGAGQGYSSGSGPVHSSSTANTLDPRVKQGSHTGTGTDYGSHTGGPVHSSSTANKLDPRVSQDDYNSGTGSGARASGGIGTQYNAGQIDPQGGNAPLRGGALGGIQPAGGNYGSTSGGAGSDPRFTSRIEGQDTLGSGHTGSGSGGAFGTADSAIGTGTTARTTGQGVPGGVGGSGTAIGSGTGTASRTAGPHDSNVANKLDPRVDSDRDGSRTIGGNATNKSQSNEFANKDPTDAAQVPPSVMSKHIGHPEVAHDDHTHDRARRHSTKPGDSLRDYGSGSA